MIVDDQPIVRRGLDLMLRGEGYVVSEASDGEQAVELAASVRPHLVIMDVAMPGISGVEATRQLHAQDPAIHILMLSFRDDPETVHAALEAGATSYLTKEAASPEALIDAVRRAAEGQAVFIPGSLVNVVTQWSTQRSNIDQLTPREREIAQLVGQGLSNVRSHRGSSCHTEPYQITYPTYFGNSVSVAEYNSHGLFTASPTSGTCSTMIEQLVDRFCTGGDRYVALVLDGLKVSNGR